VVYLIVLGRRTQDSCLLSGAGLHYVIQTSLSVCPYCTCLSNRSALASPLLDVDVSLTTARARSAARRRSTEHPTAPRDTDAGQPAAGTARWSRETARTSPPQRVSRNEWEAV